MSFPGLDVNHGKSKVREGFPKMPSTVGIVGTRNINATLYTAFMKAQRKPESNEDREVIQPSVLKPAVTEMLKQFYKTSSRKPERIIVYRDGVSNGQFLKVLATEMKTIMEACEELPASNGTRYRPPITFVTVQKRHDSRLFPEKITNDFKGREKQNAIAGTVVDTEMVTKRWWNFFLCSHEGIQGTSKPAHYSVLFDENDFSNDQLQSLTYYLCHLYGKCPRAVSLPAPTYYAHWTAFRAAEIGNLHFYRKYGFDSSGYTPGESVVDHEKNAVQLFNEAIDVDKKYSTKMYFL